VQYQRQPVHQEQDYSKVGDMKNKIQMVDDDQVENVGIMSGFMDDLEGLLEELSAEEMEGMEEGDEADMARTMKRSPDSPEILMNNLRGDMRSIDARREELSDLVGFREAEETPEGVLALLQPILGQQAAPMPPQGMPAMPPQGMPAMPPQGMPPMPPQGMPPMMPPQGMPAMPPQGMPPQQLAAGGPVGYADGGAPVSQLMGNIARQGQQEGVGYGSDNGSVIEQAMRNIARQGQQEGVGYGSNNGSVIEQAMRNIAPPMGERTAMPPQMPISPDDAAIRDLLLQQGQQVAPPVPGPATGGIGSLAPPVAPVGGINDEGIMRTMQEEQQRRMMEEEQQRRMMEERMPMPPYDPRMPMPPYDPRTGGVGKPMPPYDPRTGGVGKPIYDLLPVIPPMDDGTTIGYDPRPPMMPPMMPPMDDRMPPMMPVGTPVDQRPMFAPQRMPAFSPPPDSGVGALFAPANAPRFMADGGMVQHFQDGSGEAGVTPSGTYSPEIIAETLRRMVGSSVPTLRQGVEENLPLLQELLGSDPRDTQAQMLFDIGQAALGYAGNVGPDGQPLRGSAAARLAGATRELPGRIGARAAGMSKEAQALKMAALQTAQGERSAAQALELERSKNQVRPMSDTEKTQYGITGDAANLPWVMKGGAPTLPGGYPTPPTVADPNAKGLEKYLESLATSMTKKQDEASKSAGLLPEIDNLLLLSKAAGEGRANQVLTDLFPAYNEVGAAYKNVVSRLLPQMRAPGSGAQSDKDIEVLRAGFGGLEDTAAVRELVLQTMRRKSVLDNQKLTVIGRIGLPPEDGGLSILEANNEILKLNNQTVMPQELVAALAAILPEGAMERIYSGSNENTGSIRSPEEIAAALAATAAGNN
jgi:hypothetical protein